MARKRTSQSIARQIDRDYQEIKNKIEEAMATLDKGSAAYLNHLKEWYDVGQRWRRERAERNLDPLSLGLVMTPSYNFIAKVTPSRVYMSAEDQEFRRKMNEEFGFVPEKRYSDPDDEPEGSGPAPAPLAALPPVPAAPPNKTAVVTPGPDEGDE